MTAVWDHAAVSGGTLLVLLAMADWASDDGTGVFPMQATLAAKARLKDRQVRNCLTELEEKEYIYRDGKVGSVVRWRVEIDPAKIATRQPITGDSGNPVPTEPSTEPSKGEANASPLKAKDLSEVYGEPQTPGSAAAPYFVLELARLMRVNDDKVRLPVGLRESVQVWAQFAERTPGKATAVFTDAGWHPSLKQWLDAGRLLVDSDDREPREIVKVLRWSQDDPFWMNNIHALTKFRTQYDRLRGLAAITPTARPADREVRDTRAQLDNLTRRPKQEDE